LFAALLEKHAVPYEVLTEPRPASVERARRNSDHPGVEFNDTTSTAWAVELLPAQTTTLEPGTLIVPATQGTAGRKAALILEPTLVESLYEFSPYRELEDSNGHLPVLRLL
jgi:hypothetical protein